MHDKHEPREEFVEKLERQISHEARRWNRSSRLPRAATWSRAKAALAVLSLMLVSMVIGGTAVAMAYQSRENEHRDVLLSGFDRRAQLARERLKTATEQLQSIETGISLGTVTQEALFDGRVKVADAQAQLRIVELQLSEIRITGREPLAEVTAPLVSGRDFVGERWKIEMSVPEAALELERRRLRETERRVSLGIANEIDVDAARGRTVEVEAALEAFRRKIDIRQRFLSANADPMLTELAVLEAEAVQRQKVLTPKIAVARKQVDRARQKVQLGTGQNFELAEATLRLQELETELARVDLDLNLIRYRTGKRTYDVR